MALKHVTFQQIMEFAKWAREGGSVHVKAPGGFEAVFLPPEVVPESKKYPEDAKVDSEFERWLRARPLGM